MCLYVLMRWWRFCHWWWIFCLSYVHNEFPTAATVNKTSCAVCFFLLSFLLSVIVLNSFGATKRNEWISSECFFFARAALFNPTKKQKGEEEEEDKKKQCKHYKSQHALVNSQFFALFNRYLARIVFNESFQHAHTQHRSWLKSKDIKRMRERVK